LAGYPCDLDEINEIARAHNLAVIEDAAHALGATYRGKPISAISRFTCFSFQAINTDDRRRRRALLPAP